MSPLQLNSPRPTRTAHALWKEAHMPDQPSRSATPAARVPGRALIVLVDMDGVVVDFAAGFWQRWADRWPHAPGREYADLSRFYVDDQVPADWRAAARDLVCEAGFFADLPAVDGAAAALHAMLEHAWDVRICTAPILANPTCTSDKLAWVEQHVGDGWSERVIVTKDKTLVRGDVLVDDRPTVLGALEPTWRHVLFDATYNRAVLGAGVRLERWSRWAEILEPLLAQPATPLAGGTHRTLFG
ncbi:5' nucleotidase, NT5C type [Cellulomonas sp. CW35]|uniref:5' nucleotidase, NT5C type n=1 Tax=Cellulomonas sp. CW35 TaxID=3458249 RepID=UPI004034BE18